MLRERIDELLDGTLDPAAVRELEATLARDPAAGRLLAHMKAERALRTAAYESYAPTRVEASALATRLLDEAYHTPLGRVGYWIRHGSAVAAAVLVVAGSFLAGHMTAPVRERLVQLPPETQEVFTVVSTDARGNTLVSPELRSAKDRDEYVQARGNFWPKVTPSDIAGNWKHGY